MAAEYAERAQKLQQEDTIYNHLKFSIHGKFLN